MVAWMHRWAPVYGLLLALPTCAWALVLTQAVPEAWWATETMRNSNSTDLEFAAEEGGGNWGDVTYHIGVSSVFVCSITVSHSLGWVEHQWAPNLTSQRSLQLRSDSRWP